MCTCMVTFLPAIFAMSSYSSKVNTMIFVVLLQVRKVNLKKNHFTHLQQYDKKHFVYLARIGHHNEKSWRKCDHACAT